MFDTLRRYKLTYKKGNQFFKDFGNYNALTPDDIVRFSRDMT